MQFQLTEGSVATILSGGSVSNPVMQLLDCRRIPASDVHQLLISDGRHMTRLALLSPKCNDKLTSEELSDYSVIRIDSWSGPQPQPKRLLVIKDLTILAKGEEVGFKIGQPVHFRQSDATPPAVEVHRSAAQPPVIHGMSAPVAAALYDLLQKCMAESPEMLHKALVCAAAHPLNPLREVFGKVAEKPPAVRLVFVRRIMMSLALTWHVAARRQAAAAAPPA